LIVRPVQPGDKEEWLRLRYALWPDSTIEELRAELEEILADQHQAVFVVPRPNGGLGGFLEASLRSVAEGCSTSPVGYLEGWFIDLDLRRQGYGATLVKAAETWAIERGCQEMASDALVDNVLSLRAHTALGYQEVERLIHFRKDL
jgi:aminoglycoside 6'-N-acetyltransferase I